MANFTHEGRRAGLPDIARDYLFRITIPGLSSIIPFGSSEDIELRAQSAPIPGSEVAEIELNWMGSKEYYPSKRTPTTEGTISFIEHEDMLIHNIFSVWVESMQATDHRSASAGSASLSKKRGGYSTDIYVELLSYDTSKVLRKVKLINAWPKGVPDIELAYENEGNITLDIDFKFDDAYIIL